MLVSDFRNIASKTITKHANDKGGIMAWEARLGDFDNDGSKTLHMEVLEETVCTPYNPNQTGSLAAYLDKFMTALQEKAQIDEECQRSQWYGTTSTDMLLQF